MPSFSLFLHLERMFPMKKLLSIFSCLSLSVILVAGTGCTDKKVDKVVDTKKVEVTKDGKTTSVEVKDTVQKTTTKNDKDAPVVVVPPEKK